MKKTKFVRLLALCLAAVSLIGIVGALSYDQNGDNKTNVWDLQLLVNKNESVDAALEEALGGKNQLKLEKDTDGAYVIDSVMALYQMAKHATEGATFKLAKDIDLNGANWAPIASFKGHFDGQGYTIKNFTITSDVYVKDGNSMGFFGVVDFNGKDSAGNNIQSIVENVNFENVNLVISEDMTRTYYVGTVAGSNRGIVRNCTAVSFVTDKRTTLEVIEGEDQTARIGALIGRNNNSTPAGKLETANTMLITDNTINITHDVTQTVASKMGMDFATLESGKRNIGIAGYTDSANLINTAGGSYTQLRWQDISNSSEYSEILKARRTTAAQYMYDMGMVYWTPSQDLKLIWYKTGTGVHTTSKYEPSKLYRGIPYNHGSSSLERFEYWVNNAELPTDAFYLTEDSVIAQFNNVANNTLPDGVTTFQYNGKTYLSKITVPYTDANGNAQTTTYTAKLGDFFGITYVDGDDNNYIPSDWVDSKVTGTYITGFGRYIGNDCSSAASWAWRQISAVASSTGYASPSNTNNMITSPRYTTNTSSGYYNGIVPVGGLTFEDPKNASGSDVTDSASYAKVVNAAYDADPNSFLEALTHASMADCLMGYRSAGGHTLMLMGDAVTIRKPGGTIDADLSYVITTEQGGSYGTRKGTYNGKDWSSSWGVNEKRTFAQVVGYGQAYDDTFERYFPITIDALRNEDSAAATAWCKVEGGAVKSNFHINSTTANGKTVYTKTTMSNSRAAYATMTAANLVEAHGEGVTELVVTLANGDSYDVNLTTGTCTKK